jgi:hypothetical protein
MKDSRRTSPIVWPTILIFMALLYWLMPARNPNPQPSPSAELPVGSLPFTPSPDE